MLAKAKGNVRGRKAETQALTGLGWGGVEEAEEEVIRQKRKSKRHAKDLEA
ncbi:hypothetical protein GCM10011375_37540 [Hymenobacter qilianensis]|uniref:Uncharacterized protein n=1 Tax=Hymenobacter qilianensis TaxID=1385715 RepID=A0ACB5PWG7_9BACT|nr:hypothetical protein GCM10011375_37540 [Hymenobacter qilianensis]